MIHTFQFYQRKQDSFSPELLYSKTSPFIDIILIWLSSDTESAEAAEGAKDEKDAEEGDANNKEKVDEEAAINNNNTKKSVTARFTITFT